MRYVVSAPNQRRQELLEQINATIDAERKERSRDAWYHGVLWAICKLPPDIAKAVADDLLALQPDREGQINFVLNNKVKP